MGGKITPAAQPEDHDGRRCAQRVPERCSPNLGLGPRRRPSDTAAAQGPDGRGAPLGLETTARQRCPGPPGRASSLNLFFSFSLCPFVSSGPVRFFAFRLASPGGRPSPPPRRGVDAGVAFTAVSRPVHWRQQPWTSASSSNRAPRGTRRRPSAIIPQRSRRWSASPLWSLTEVRVWLLRESGPQKEPTPERPPTRRRPSKELPRRAPPRRGIVGVPLKGEPEGLDPRSPGGLGVAARLPRRPSPQGG